MAAMMCDMDVHGEKDFPAGKTAIGGVVRGAELFVGEVADYGGAILERIA